MAMVSVIQQSPVLMEQISHRTPPRKPFYLRSDGMRSVTGVPASVKAARRSTADDSFGSYNLKTARRRVASVCVAVSPRNQSQIRYCDVMAVDSDAWSSDEETTAIDLRSARRKGRSLSWMFPLPPQVPKLSDKPAQLDLKLDALSGLGLDGIAAYSLTSVEAPLSGSASTSPQTSESSLESQAGQRHYYDSDGLTGSQGWSPSTCADSEFPSPAIDQGDDAAEEAEFNTSIVTKPLSIRKASGRLSSLFQTGDEEESDEYYEPLYSSEDQQKMERLRSSLTLLEFDSPVPGDEVEVLQQDYDLTHLAPPPAQTDLRMIYSPEHGAPSLAEQLAFACGNGYRYNVAESSTHYDSAAEYLPELIRPQLIEMSPAPSLDPFSGLRAETGDSWSEAHGGDMDERFSAYSPDAARLSRGPSLLGQHYHGAMSMEPAEMEPSSPVGSISSGSDSFKSSRSSIALSASTAHTGCSDPLEAVKELEVDLPFPEEGHANADASIQSTGADDVEQSVNGSPGTEALAEFSFMTLLNDLVPSTPLPLDFESRGTGQFSPPISTPEVELEMQSHGSMLEPMSDLPSPTDASFPSGSLPFNNSSSMASIHSQLLSSASFADGLFNRADLDGSCSMTRSQSSTSILDRGRPIRGGTSFLPQRAGVARVQQTVPAAAPRQPSAAKINIPKRVSSRGRLAQPADDEESVEEPKKVEKGILQVPTDGPSPASGAHDTGTSEPVTRPAKPSYSRQSSSTSIPSSLVPGQGNPSQRPFRPGHRTVSSTSRACPLPMSRESSRPGIDLFATSRPRVLSDEAYEGLQQAMKEAQAARLKKESANSSAGKMTSSQSMPAGLVVDQAYRGQSQPHLRFKDQPPKSTSQSKGKEQASDYGSKQRPVILGSQSMVQLPSIVQSSRRGMPSSSSSKSLKTELPSLPAQPERAQSLPQLPPKPSRPTVFARDHQAAPLPTLFTARSVSQRLRGDTGIPETQPDLRRIALQAQKQRSQFGGGIVSSVVRWGHARALKKEEVKTETPGGCVLVVEEKQSTTEKVVLI